VSHGNKIRPDGSPGKQGFFGTAVFGWLTSAHKLRSAAHLRQ
jgi:hypothetical protein